MISAILILHFTTGGDTFFRQQSRRNLSGPANPYPAFCGGKTKTEKTNALARSCSQEKFHSDRYSTIIEFNNSEFQVEEVRPQTTGTYHRIQGTGDRIQRTENREQRQESREGFYYEPLNPITDLSRDGTGRDNRIVGTTFEIGKPELPGIFQMLGIPNNASYQVKIIEIETDTIKGLIIYPLQPPTTENRDWGLGIGDYTTAFGDWEFVIDRDFYNSDILYPASPVCIDNPGVWRDVNVAILRIYPFAYNPIDSTLIVYKRLIVQISYSMFSSLKVASNYYRMYKSELLNFESMNVEEDKGDSVKYLVIAYDSLLPAIMPLVDWHHKRGIDIEVVPVCSVGITAQEIKSYIANKYYTNGLDYVLLVGDIEHIPLYNWDSYPSQYWYACITGDSTPDMYPDLAIGRLSVKDTAELANQVNKTLTYMKVPLLDDWLTKSILCAHKETSPDNYATFKENIRKYEYDYFNPTFDTVYGRSDGTTAQLISAINEGRNIINYRGHGSTTSWAAWDCNGGYLQDTEVKLLTNIRTPIVLNMCCATGDIGSLSDCLCETWMKAVGGAVAAYGVTRSTNTEPHNIFDEHFYKAFGNVLPGIFDVG
ncbi:MAG: hypothetical protein HY769_06905, partial [Candidatus Stahlbacteria bacterium]|nr:hypothetical protein [Candidatus Stahlbacteria bacterium]